METNQYLTEFYNSYDEDSRLAPRHGSVEFLTTMRYIEKYIKPGDRVLEIGAGSGRYSHALARQGYAVDAVELVEHNIQVFKQNTQPQEHITVTQGMPWISLRSPMAPTISRCFWGRSTTSMMPATSGRPSARRCGSRNRAAWCSPPM